MLYKLIIKPLITMLLFMVSLNSFGATLVTFRGVSSDSTYELEISHVHAPPRPFGTSNFTFGTWNIDNSNALPVVAESISGAKFSAVNMNGLSPSGFNLRMEGVSVFGMYQRDPVTFDTLYYDNTLQATLPVTVTGTPFFNLLNINLYFGYSSGSDLIYDVDYFSDAGMFDYFTLLAGRNQIFEVGYDSLSRLNFSETTPTITTNLSTCDESCFNQVFAAFRHEAGLYNRTEFSEMMRIDSIKWVHDSPVPAPPAFILMLTGLGVLGLTKRFRKSQHHY